MNTTSRFFRLPIAGFAGITAIMIATAGITGECPADKVQAGAMQPGATAPKDVTDMVLSHIDLASQKIGAEDYTFRMRQLVIQPGGEVPWHDHAERPALIYIVSGAITEYSSNCAVPIEHKAGDAAKESIGLKHWWRNNGTTPAVLISADILHEAKKEDHTM